MRGLAHKLSQARPHLSGEMELQVSAVGGEWAGSGWRAECGRRGQLPRALGFCGIWTSRPGTDSIFLQNNNKPNSTSFSFLAPPCCPPLSLPPSHPRAPPTTPDRFSRPPCPLNSYCCCPPCSAGTLRALPRYVQCDILSLSLSAEGRRAVEHRAASETSI